MKKTIQELRKDQSFEELRKQGLDSYWDRYHQLRALGYSHADAKMKEIQASIINGNGHLVEPVTTFDAAGFLSAATAEDVLNLIQSRIDELHAEVDRLTAELTEARVAKEAAQKELFDCQKAGREQASTIRALKEEAQRKTGLRLFR